jgi:hypothetical protein
MFIANPDLPERIRRKGPYTELRGVGLYGGDQTGKRDRHVDMTEAATLAQRDLVDGHRARPTSGASSRSTAKFAMASGEMSETEFQSFLADTLGAAVRVSRDGAVHFICMDWRQGPACRVAGADIDTIVKTSPVAPVDTTAAGDSFAAAYLAASGSAKISRAGALARPAYYRAFGSADILLAPYRAMTST